MKKLSLLMLSLFVALVLNACADNVTTSGTTATTATTQAAIWPNLKQFRIDMANEMLAAQSPDVDTKAGATDSSLGWIKAVENALTQAESTTTPGTYIDGTYSGEGDKRQYGYENATVTIVSGEITEIILRRLNNDGTEVDYNQWTGQPAQ
ncbi:MAG: FMN-binding domain protein [Haloplasmataceae bacterium]|jgi:uncharacterized protein with FMN-binding domain|nr:FMN-binding domain protein [Haloplasmataceae bacterium]